MTKQKIESKLAKIRNPSFLRWGLTAIVSLALVCQSIRSV